MGLGNSKGELERKIESLDELLKIDLLSSTGELMIRLTKECHEKVKSDEDIKGVVELFIELLLCNLNLKKSREMKIQGRGENAIDNIQKKMKDSKVFTPRFWAIFDKISSSRFPKKSRPINKEDFEGVRCLDTQKSSQKSNRIPLNPFNISECENRLKQLKEEEMKIFNHETNFDLQQSINKEFSSYGENSLQLEKTFKKVMRYKIPEMSKEEGKNFVIESFRKESMKSEEPEIERGNLPSRIHVSSNKENSFKVEPIQIQKKDFSIKNHILKEKSNKIKKNHFGKLNYKEDKDSSSSSYSDGEEEIERGSGMYCFESKTLSTERSFQFQEVSQNNRAALLGYTIDSDEDRPSGRNFKYKFV